MHQEMSGYQAARGDFTHEFDNFAELDLQDMDFDNARDDDELDKGDNHIPRLVKDVFK